MNIMKHARTVAAVALALSSLTVALPARADGPGATLGVQAGWEGQAHAGVLVPVWVDLTAGPQAVKGQLQLHYTQTNPWGQGKPSGIYTLDVQIPAGGHVRKLMLVQNDSGGGLGPLKLMVDGQEAASAEVKLENQSVTRLMGVLGDDTVAQALAIPEPTETAAPGPQGGGGKFGGMPSIPEASRPVRLIHLDAAKLPDRGVGLEALDVVVVDRFAAGNLTPEQRKTLQDYVAAGGKLMLAGGPEGARVIQPFADWLGVKVGDVKNVPLSTFGAPQPQGPVAERTVPVLTIEGKGLRTMATAGGQPVALAKNVGAGSVLLLTYDPALAPLAGWDGRKPYWDDLVRGIFPANPFQMGGPWGPGPAPGGIDMQMTWAVQRVAGGNMPSQTKWLLLLGGYALLLGPVNFLIWRLVKRPGAAWPTALVGAMGATLIFWPLARRLDPPVIVNPVAVLYGSSDSSVVKVSQLVGVTTLPESKGEVSMPKADWVSMVALPPQGPFNGPPPIVDTLGTIDLEKNTVQVTADLKGGSQAIVATGTADLGGSLALDVHMVKDHLEGTLTNRTDRTWNDVILAAGQSYLKVAAKLEPGQTEKISFLLPSAMPPGGCCGIIGVQAGISQAYQPIFTQGGAFQEIAAWPMVQRQNLAQAVGNHFWTESGGSYQVVLVGWTDDVPLPIEVGGQTRKVKGVAMLGQEVKLTLGKGEYTLPPGLMPGTNTEWVVDDPQFNGMFGPDMGVPAVGSASYSFQLPTELQPAGVKNLTLALSMPQAGKPPTTEFWNWSKNAWEEVTVQGGVESKIDGGKRFVSPTGEMRVRISRHEKPDPMRGGMYPIGKPLVGVQGEEVAS